MPTFLYRLFYTDLFMPTFIYTFNVTNHSPIKRSHNIRGIKAFSNFAVPLGPWTLSVVYVIFYILNASKNNNLQYRRTGLKFVLVRLLFLFVVRLH